MAEGDSTNRERVVPGPNDVQAHITTFWSTVAPDYEAHGGNVAAFGSAEYQTWVDALASVS